MFVWWIVCEIYRRAEENRELIMEFVGIAIFLSLGILIIFR